jgi:hypothetical protein
MGCLFSKVKNFISSSLKKMTNFASSLLWKIKKFFLTHFVCRGISEEDDDSFFYCALRPPFSMYIAQETLEEPPICKRVLTRRKTAIEMAKRFFSDRLYLDKDAFVCREDLIKEWNLWKSLPGNRLNYHQIHEECSQLVTGLRIILKDFMHTKKIMINGQDYILYCGISLK